MRPTRAFAALVLVAAIASGCSSDDSAKDSTAAGVKQLDVSFVPTSLLGYELEPEKTEGLDDVQRSYVDAVRLYSLRDGEQLIATMQVGRFADGADWDKGSFQRSVLSQIGASTPTPIRLGDETVYITAGVKQRLAVWFRDGYLFVLGTRDEFDRPRSLLREAMEVTP